MRSYILILGLTLLMISVSGCDNAPSRPLDQSRWIYLGNAQGWIIYLDTKQISSEDGQVKAWVREAKIERMGPSGQLPDKRRLFSIDCEAMTSRQLMVISYDAEGRVLEKDSRATSDKPIVPDTFGEAVSEALCHGESGLREARELSYQTHAEQPSLNSVRAKWH